MDRGSQQKMFKVTSADLDDGCGGIEKNKGLLARRPL